MLIEVRRCGVEQPRCRLLPLALRDARVYYGRAECTAFENELGFEYLGARVFLRGFDDQHIKVSETIRGFVCPAGGRVASCAVSLRGTHRLVGRELLVLLLSVHHAKLHVSARLADDNARDIGVDDVTDRSCDWSRRHATTPIEVREEAQGRARSPRGAEDPRRR
jgi:hypothetical protein